MPAPVNNMNYKFIKLICTIKIRVRVDTIIYYRRYRVDTIMIYDIFVGTTFQVNLDG